ncbi:hypothetical protein JEQ12_003592 [Ovis aries]|uniref:Uncharacterized protein n=1 Tax=Ovis aries TaxID=9940 RepID=A0A836CX09_SHEEP|nr:hypothetical protein JEQ12_003592 [Ovis aries]
MDSLVLFLLCLALVLVGFVMICISSKTHYLQGLIIYASDEVMFPKNRRCPTCEFRKPARSKHWVLKNCIGAWNTRYFLSYLLTLTVSAATMAVYLFLTFPRILFLVGFVVVLSFLLGSYLCFCLYLTTTNQITNKRPPSAEPQAYQNIHSRGHWGNLRELFLPAAAYYERKKK